MEERLRVGLFLLFGGVGGRGGVGQWSHGRPGQIGLYIHFNQDSSGWSRVYKGVLVKGALKAVLSAGRRPGAGRVGAAVVCTLLCQLQNCFPTLSLSVDHRFLLSSVGIRPGPP